MESLAVFRKAVSPKHGHEPAEGEEFLSPQSRKPFLVYPTSISRQPFPYPNTFPSYTIIVYDTPVLDPMGNWRQPRLYGDGKVKVFIFPQTP